MRCINGTRHVGGQQQVARTGQERGAVGAVPASTRLPPLFWPGALTPFDRRVDTTSARPCTAAAISAVAPLAASEVAAGRGRASQQVSVLRGPARMHGRAARERPRLAWGWEVSKKSAARRDTTQRSAAWLTRVLDVHIAQRGGAHSSAGRSRRAPPPPCPLPLQPL